MFRKDPTEAIVKRFANESQKAQLDFANSEDLKQLDNIIKNIENKIIAYKKR